MQETRGSPAVRPLTAVRPSPTPVEPPPAAGAFRGRARDVGVEVASVLSVDGLQTDLDVYEVRRDGTPIEVSPRQVEILALFLAAPGRVWSREQLHWVCWQDTSPSRRVDVQLCRIRAKVGGEIFRNVRDRGWSLRTA